MCGGPGFDRAQYQLPFSSDSTLTARSNSKPASTRTQPRMVLKPVLQRPANSRPQLTCRLTCRPVTLRLPLSLGCVSPAWFLTLSLTHPTPPPTPGRTRGVLTWTHVMVARGPRRRLPRLWRRRWSWWRRTLACNSAKRVRSEEWVCWAWGRGGGCIIFESGCSLVPFLCRAPVGCLGLERGPHFRRGCERQ